MMKYIEKLLLCIFLLSPCKMMADTYELYLCGTQVTDDNCSNLTGIKGVSIITRKSEAVYNPSLNTLFLKDVIIEDASGVALLSSTNKLNIVVSGTVSIVSKATDGIGIRLTKPTVIRSSNGGKLNVGANKFGLLLEAPLTLSNIQLKAVSEGYGIGGSVTTVSLRKMYLGSLLLQGQSTVAEVKGTRGCIANLNKLELEDGLSITEPSGSIFKNHGVMNAGSLVKGTSVVIKYEAPKKKGDVNLDGNVDISDIVAVINQIAGTATYSNADVNKDTNIDISDIVAIINIIANGSEDEQPEDPEKPEEPDAAVKEGYCPDNHHPHIIDFGENKKWACCNVGASAPWEYGNYYSWGDLEPKDIYTWDNYTFLKEETGQYVSLITIQNSQNDVAYQSWGGMWNMPDTENIEELGKIANNSDGSEWTTLNGVNGWKVQDQTGHAIFLPAAGLQGPDGPEDIGEKGTYWTSDRSSNIYSSGFPQIDPYAWIISFNSETFNKFTPYRENCRERALGLPVRPVINEDIETEDMDLSVVYNLCPDSHHPHEIDMGGGGIWLCCNLGASVPWEYGSYYAWGETEPDKKSFEWDTYAYWSGNENNDCLPLGNDISGTSYDAVRSQMGAPWALPSAGQAQWLSDNCTFEWITMHSICGLKATAPNGHSLFLPAAGCKSKNGDYSVSYNDGVFYSLSSLDMAYSYLNKIMHTINTHSMNISATNRCLGQSLRPVKQNTPEEPSVAAGICPDSHHPHAIDLGTGVRWSCCNVGAAAPWHYGDFYSWGETFAKSSYDVDTYSLGDGTFENFTNIGTDIAGTEYDAALAICGNSWTMPTYEQAQMLVEQCSATWTQLNGTEGVMLTGKNNNRIFFPFTGGYWGNRLSSSNGGLWTSTANTSNVGNAFYLDIAYDLTDKNNPIGYVTVKSIWRFIGKQIRAVK